MSIFVAIFILGLLALIVVQEMNRLAAERVLREQQQRIESLQETNKALRAKPFHQEART